MEYMYLTTEVITVKKKLTCQALTLPSLEAKHAALQGLGLPYSRTSTNS